MFSHFFPPRSKKHSRLIDVSDSKMNYAFRTCLSRIANLRSQPSMPWTKKLALSQKFSAYTSHRDQRPALPRELFAHTEMPATQSHPFPPAPFPPITVLTNRCLRIVTCPKTTTTVVSAGKWKGGKQPDSPLFPHRPIASYCKMSTLSHSQFI